MSTDHEHALAFDRETARRQKMADDIVDDYNAKRLRAEQRQRRRERIVSFINRFMRL